MAGLLLATVVSTASAAPPEPPKPCEPGSTSRLERPPTQPPGTSDPGNNDPSITTGSGRNENLSDRLARSDGVLCPPNVDPDMRVPPPAGGKTPVIPPPGSPGGDPNVRPK